MCSSVCSIDKQKLCHWSVFGVAIYLWFIKIVQSNSNYFCRKSQAHPNWKTTTIRRAVWSFDPKLGIMEANWGRPTSKSPLCREMWAFRTAEVFFFNLKAGLATIHTEIHLQKFFSRNKTSKLAITVSDDWHIFTRAGITWKGKKMSL